MNDIPINDIEAPAPDCSEQEQQVATLTQELADLRRLYDQARTQRDNLMRDIERIGEHMQETATDHDYCSVYDNAVDWLNSQMLGGVYLPTRSVTVERDFRITVSWTATGVDEDELYSSIGDAVERAIGDVTEYTDFSIDDSSEYVTSA